MKPISVSIQWSADDERPRYRQVADALREEILTGGLAPGSRLPSSRSLASQLGLNPVTVVHAYRELSRLGLVESVVGSGTYVSSSVFSSDGGAEEIFSVQVLRRVFNRILDTAGISAFTYSDAGGYGPLLASIRAYLTGEGVSPGEDRLVVFSGAQQGLSVIVQALCQPGDWVLVERPTYPGALRVFQRSGLRVESVSMGIEGPELRDIERVFRTRPLRLAYTMPVYQNPTGACYGAVAREGLMRLCREHSVILVEDDALSDIDFGAGHHAPLRAGVDRAEGPCDHLYLKSFSHLVLPGFRLGFCLCRPSMADLLRRVKEETDLFSSGFFQRVLDLLLREGHFAAHVRQLAERDRHRFSVCTKQAVSRLQSSGIRVQRPMGGESLWCRLPGPAEPGRFLTGVASLGLPVTPGDRFTVDGSLSRWFSLSFADMPFERWKSVLEDVARLVAESQA